MDVVFPIVGLLLIASAALLHEHVKGLVKTVRWGWQVLRDEQVMRVARRAYRGGQR